ncbi:alpha/beta hydrolase [Catenulispora subtropica]|uniref:Alpha/beta hydrolase n=1 Tax=Catenulispora subtropica TaxID=450798 RepID=A0ABP5D547_9ACTN
MASAKLTLPAPTGPYRVGVVDLRIVDKSRPDPVAGPGHFRELMTSVWYPARETARYQLAPWMPPASWGPYVTDQGFDPGVFQPPLTSGHTGAPVLRTERRLPVVVYSHGAHSHRSDNTVVAQELASHGYAVVTIDHTYDAWVAFPDGRVLSPSFTVPMTPKDFAADARSVLDAIEDLAAGRNPDADGRQLPDGLAHALDPRRIGMFGWSKGGTATAYTMLTDDRVRAGLSFDGPMAPQITTDLNRPFMDMTAVFTRADDPDVALFWSHLKGWRLNVQADGAAHSCYSDAESLIPQVARILGMSQQDVESYVGTLDPAEGVHMQQAYPRAFFDLHLRGRRSHLLDGPSPAFPDVKFLP